MTSLPFLSTNLQIVVSRGCSHRARYIMALLTESCPTLRTQPTAQSALCLPMLSASDAVIQQPDEITTYHDKNLDRTGFWEWK